MNENYNYSPDVLDLVIELSQVPELNVHQIKTAFGYDDKQYVFYKDIVIGVIVEAAKYYSALKLNIEDKQVISLVPAMRDIQNIDLPSIDEFEKLLKGILNCGFGHWFLVCERDCEEIELEKYHYNTQESKEQINSLFLFCKSGNYNCPTFLIKN